jgi:hypothetical protein
MQRPARKLLTAGMLASLWLAGCGGGGGGDSGNDTRVSANLTSIDTSRTVAEAAPTVIVRVTATNVPPEGLYAGVTYSGLAVTYVDFAAVSASEIDLDVDLAQPGGFSPGTYEGNVQFDVCLDAYCDHPVDGSPIRIPIEYVVVGVPPVAVTADPPLVDVSAAQEENLGAGFYIVLTFPSPLAVTPYASVQHGQTIVDSYYSSPLSSTELQLFVTLFDPDSLAQGSHSDTLVIDVCYTDACVNKVSGSPLRIPVSYTVTPPGAQHEPGVDPLVPSSVHSLSHDVLDAEYSTALESVIMVSSYPSNALYVYGTNTGTEVQVPLSKLPTAVSLSPDGLRAAIGHDGLITHVDLATLGQPGGAVATVLNVSAPVFDLVLDGRGYVHAFPTADQWVNMHSVEVATNTEHIGDGLFYDSEHARLHPSGDYIYGANNGVFPSDIEKFDITSVPTTRLYDSPYHGDYEMCGDLWFSEDGNNIYTACGNAFRASTAQANDMVYAGSLRLSISGYPYIIGSLSQSGERDEIALVEYESWECVYGDPAACFVHLGIYDSDSLSRTALYSFAPMTVDGIVYGQRGLFVFHSADGGRRFTLSKLYAMPNPDAEYYLSEF